MTRFSTASTIPASAEKSTERLCRERYGVKTLPASALAALLTTAHIGPRRLVPHEAAHPRIRSPMTIVTLNEPKRRGKYKVRHDQQGKDNRTIDGILFHSA